jgi:murein L,D-transpeptidase YcbB/YkuD
MQNRLIVIEIFLTVFCRFRALKIALIWVLLSGIQVLGAPQFTISDSRPSENISRSEFLKSWLTSQSVIHFSLDRRDNLVKKFVIILETYNLVKLYQARNFAPIWINSDFQKSVLVQRFLDYIPVGAGKHGLNEKDYLSFELNALLQIASDSQNWMYAELMLADAFLKMGKDISVGRLDFSQLEREFKMGQQEFRSFELLQSAMNSANDIEFAERMDKLAPQSDFYRSQLKILKILRDLQLTAEWQTPIVLNSDLKLGFKSAQISRIRQRMADLNYQIELGSPFFDEDFLRAVKDFQIANSLKVDGMISKKGSLIRLLNKSLKSRIEQVQVNLERIRFLPRKLDANYVFVNTAFAELRVFENSKVIMKFKTVVGKKTRRTPSKIDSLRKVIFNPTWTISPTIFKKDKLSHIQNDMDYLQRHRIKVIDPKSGIEFSSLDFDWGEVESKSGQFPYQLVQQPGYFNALGVVKFPLYLKNDNIYMHDTNEKNFFEPEVYDRHRSSGCVRLEKPIEFAEYLLKKNKETPWSLEKIKSIIPPQVAEADLIIHELDTHRELPVYLLYLTSELGEKEQVRFHEDIYGQDSRWIKVLHSNMHNSEEFVSADSVRRSKQGILKVLGEAGPTQLFPYVKAIPCRDMSQRSPSAMSGNVEKASCHLEKAIAVPLNTDFKLPYGAYILAFENSIYPGFVRINEKSHKVKLERLSVSGFENQRSNSKYRVVRDFGVAREINKQAFQTYFVQQPIFKLAQYSFGGWYLKGSMQKDISSRLNYRNCESVRIFLLSEEAREMCENAKTNDLIRSADFFSINKTHGIADGTFTEQWVSDDVMDIVEVKHPYHLVAAPLAHGEFVSVFPGSYRILDEANHTVQKNDIGLKNIPHEYLQMFIKYQEKTNENAEFSEDSNI